MRTFQREFTQLLSPFVASPCWYLYSANGAAFTSKPGAAPQDYGNPKTRALKARFTFQDRFYPEARLNRAFSACLHGDFNSWGDAPGWFEISPLAVNRNTFSREKLE
jgi:hypothetical protein